MMDGVMNKPFWRWLAAAGCILAMVQGIVACERADGPSVKAAATTGPLRVVVTIPPLLWAAKKVSPADAEVTLILAPGQSEHGFEITPSQFKAINDADLVAMVGYGLEPKVEATMKLGRRDARRVVSFEGIEGANPIAADPEHVCEDPSHDHSHHDHSHAQDPHVWLDPVVMKGFVQRLGAEMIAKIEASGTRFSDEWKKAERTRIEATVAELVAECDAIDGEYKETLAGVSTRKIVTHHNAYAYIARRYGLEVAAVIRPVEVVEPTPGDIKSVTDAIREHSLKAIFIEPQFSATAAERIAQATGIKMLPIDPLGEGDWAATMRKNLASLAAGLGG